MNIHVPKWLFVVACGAIVACAVLWRLTLAATYPCCTTGDAPVYWRLAGNIEEGRGYSIEATPPYRSTSIRLPGYPLFLAALRAARADAERVRMVQAVIDVATAVLVCLIARAWCRSTSRRRAVGFIALLLASACPLTAIFAASILTETVFTLVLAATVLVATYGIQDARREPWLMACAGVLAGIGTLVRPEGILVVAALVTTLAVTHRRRSGRPGRPQGLWAVVAVCAGCATAILPWTVWAVRHGQEVLPPTHTILPDGSIPRGYFAWLRTWVTDDSQTDSLIWTLGYSPIEIDQIPASAFDSADERRRVAALLQEYSLSTYRGSASGTDRSATATPAQFAQLVRPDRGSMLNEGMLWRIPERADDDFARLARERVHRHPARFYLLLPAQRIIRMWFGNHTTYFGETSARMARSFKVLVGAYSILAFAGAYKLLKSGAVSVLTLGATSILFRLALLSTLENPEPRYIVPLLPLTLAFAALAIAPASRGVE